MKLCCLLLLASCTAATPLESSSREKYTTLPPDVFTAPTMLPEAKSRFAMLDDVRLLANGLLQLGQSLREFVHKTKGQINDIFQKLNIFDRSFYQLSVVTSEIKEEEEELKKTTNYLKANNEEIKNLSLEINSKINSILQERAQLQSKVGNLEEKMQGLSQSMVPLDQVNEITTLKVSSLNMGFLGVQTRFAFFFFLNLILVLAQSDNMALTKRQFKRVIMITIVIFRR